VAVVATWITSQLVFNGLIAGLEIGMLAMGIVLIYRSTRVINFAVGNLCCDVAFNGKNVDQLAVVSFRPKMRVVLGVDQLNVNADLVGSFSHAALQNCRYAKLLCDIRNTFQ